MMNFRTIKTSITNILGNAADGRFQVVGFQRQQKQGDQALDESRMVQVYFSSGDFKRRSGGPYPFEITYQIDMTASRAAEGDLAAISDPEATSESIAAALLNFTEASQLSDESIDELFEIVFQIIMDARNIHLGLSTGIIADRFITNFQKDTPVSRGSYVTITGSATLTLQTTEDVTGDFPVAATDYDITIDIKDDDIEKTGVAGSF